MKHKPPRQELGDMLLKWILGLSVSSAHDYIYTRLFPDPASLVTWGSCSCLCGTPSSLEPTAFHWPTSRRRRCCWQCSCKGRHKERQRSRRERRCSTLGQPWPPWGDGLPPDTMEWGHTHTLWDHAWPLWRWRKLHRTAYLRTFAHVLLKCSHSSLGSWCLLLQSLFDFSI